jgi:hypothetical protein
MKNPTLFDGAKHRPMTDAEYAQWQTDAANAAAAEHAATDAAAARASALAKLAALGLTEAEVNAIIGGI